MLGLLERWKAGAGQDLLTGPKLLCTGAAEHRAVTVAWPGAGSCPAGAALGRRGPVHQFSPSSFPALEPRGMVVLSPLPIFLPVRQSSCAL